VGDVQDGDGDPGHQVPGHSRVEFELDTEGRVRAVDVHGALRHNMRRHKVVASSSLPRQLTANSAGF